MADNERKIAKEQDINITQPELIGSLITIAGFLATLLQGVQKYAQKVGAADDAPKG
jgi:acyl-CoA synthetase (NDP forming)